MIDKRHKMAIITIDMDIEFEFNPDKNTLLKKERGIGFDEIIYRIHSGHLIDTVQHHNQEKYAGQCFFLVDVEGYVYLVPFDINEGKFVLKTIFPSRKHTKKYITHRNN
jgi:hypothetical protein